MAIYIKKRPKERKHLSIPLKENNVSIEDEILKTYFTKMNSEKQTLIFINAFAMPFKIVKSFLLEIADSYNVIIYSTRGIPNFGNINENIDAQMDEHLYELFSVINHYHLINNKVVLCGWYYGYSIIAEFATRFPNKINKIFFFNGIFSTIVLDLSTPYGKAMIKHSREICKSFEANYYNRAYSAEDKYINLN